MILPRRFLVPQFLLLSAFPALDSAAQEDLSEIQDPKAREAAEVIMDKLASVEEYSCQYTGRSVEIDRSLGEARPGEVVYEWELKFKRPNLAYVRMETTKHIFAGMEGMIVETCYDGTYRWEHMQPGGGLGEFVADSLEMASGSERQAFIEQANQPTVFRDEWKAYEDAGIDNLARDQGDVVLRPFAPCDLESLKLEREDDDVWVFTAKSRRVNPTRKEHAAIRLTIGRANGVMRELHYDRGEDQYNILTVSNVELNPGFGDSVFQFSPPEGIEVDTESTQRKVKDLLEQRKDSEERNAADDR